MKGAGTEIIGRSTEILGIDVGRDGVRGSPVLSPQNDRSIARVTNPRSAIFAAYKFALCSLTAPIECPSNDCRVSDTLILVFGQKKIAGYRHFVLIWKSHLLYSHFITLVKIVSLHRCLPVFAGITCRVRWIAGQNRSVQNRCHDQKNSPSAQSFPFIHFQSFFFNKNRFHATAGGPRNSAT